MPPNSTTLSTFIEQNSQNQTTLQIDTSYRTFWGYFKTPLIWSNIIGMFLIHFTATYALVTIPSSVCQWKTIWWLIFTGYLAGEGVTGGAHRLWSHRSYKAKLPLRIFFAISYAMAGQYSLYSWVRDHRVHHKFSDTDADPHNINRGFFFAHVGWFMMKRHPEVIKKGRQIDCSDIFQDPVVVVFQKYFVPIMWLCCYVLPTMVPYFCWNETFYWSVMSSIIRHVLELNIVWSVNSFAHMFGNKPYIKTIKAAENTIVAVIGMGEGWHNYHHTFPWDYKASELGKYKSNWTACFIDLCAKLGLAYDLKTASKELIQKTVVTNGDGSYKGQ